MKKLHAKKTSLFYLLTSIISLILFLSLAYFIFNHDLTQFQEKIHQFISTLYSPILNQIIILLTKTANPLPIGISTLILTLIFIFKKKYAIAALCTGSILSLTISNIALKNYFMRERPSFEWLISEQGYSFPSGHAMMSFGIALLICFLLYQTVQNRWIAISFSGLAFMYALCIGFSRLYVSVHFLSDVLGGYLAASSVMCFIFFIYDLFYNQNQTKTGNR